MSSAAAQSQHHPPGANLSCLNIASATTAAQAVIQLALSQASRPIVTTKFGPYSPVMLHLLAEEQPDIPVVWIDTGFNTRATMDFAQSLTNKLGLNLVTYQPSHPWQGYVPGLDDAEHPDFVEQAKLEPFRRMLSELRPDMWFSALRRIQTEHRRAQPYFTSLDTSVLKVCPLIHWADEDMQAYLERYNLSSEPDYQDPTKGDVRRECGLHVRF